MVFRAPKAAPASRLPSERRGSIVGRFCHGCNQVFPLQRAFHSGDPIYGRDHVASTCAYEGWRFEPDAQWWEAAVEVLPAPAPADSAPAAKPPAGSATAAPPPASPPAGQPHTTSAPQQGQPAPAPPKG
ncbi:MAG TPA: hypothetical protein VN923_07575 [Thermoanaerobaculia bacterium]|nr:hypothetical protein [Thermoanaerobaculia bacterium]